MIDKTDKKIIEILQTDARIPVKEIANRVGMVPSAISERLKKLKEKGIIKSFEVRLDYSQLEKTLLAFVFVKTDELSKGCDTGIILAELPEVMEVFNVAGEDCYLIKVRVKNTRALGELLREKIGNINTVVSTRSTIVMETYKENLAVSLD
jgi:Lrp/AsnC family leucine-responsive transcriptional regulator